MTVAVVPAAGSSSRFGSMKLVADVQGEPLLQHTLRSLLDAGIVRVIVVAAPDHALSTVALLHDPRVLLVTNTDPERGMFSSIQVGFTEVLKDEVPVAPAAPDGAGRAVRTVVMLPADMPFVRPETTRVVVAEAERRGSVVVPIYREERGHPIAMPLSLCARVLAEDVCSNLKAAFAAAGVERAGIEVDDPGVLRDVDTTGDLMPGPPRAR